jgi:drug/metabolite transporter (DMT)-like permease
MTRARFYLMGFGALAFFDTLTQVSLKLATQRTGEFAFAMAWLHAAVLAPWVYGAIAGYLGAFVTWMKLLEHAPVGPAFAASHVDVVTVLLISVPLFGERLGATQIAGALLIGAGILFLALSESKEAPTVTRSISGSAGLGE